MDDGAVIARVTLHAANGEAVTVTAVEAGTLRRLAPELLPASAARLLDMPPTTLEHATLQALATCGERALLTSAPWLRELQPAWVDALSRAAAVRLRQFENAKTTAVLQRTLGHGPLQRALRGPLHHTPPGTLPVREHTAGWGLTAASFQLLHHWLERTPQLRAIRAAEQTLARMRPEDMLPHFRSEAATTRYLRAHLEGRG